MDTSALHSGLFAGVNRQSHTVELVDWVLQAFVYQEMELFTMIRKTIALSEPGT
jgi:hypothetical protein